MAGTSKDWTAKLDQLATVERGRSRHRPRNAPHLFGGPYPFVQTGEVKAAEFWIHKTEQTYSEAGLEQSRLWPAGTVCVTIAANIAESGVLAEDACFPDSVVGVTPYEGVADNSFLKYALDFMKLRLQAVSGGTTQDNLSLEKLLRFDFPAPPIGRQRQIAGVLRAFDDLIENNRRRIEILEEAARLLYREWFVYFRIPGHEDVGLVDSDLGPIPEGWGRTCLADELELERVNVKPFENPDEEFDHYSIPAFDDRRLPSLELGAEIKSNKYLVSGECVMVSKLNPRFPRVWRVDRSGLDRRAVASTEFLVLTNPLRWTLAFVYGLVTSSDFANRLASTAGGTSTSHQRVKVADVMNMIEVSPPAEVVKAYSAQVQPILKLADNLLQQNEVLRESRDLLLPRLVSGELDVSELDLGLEAVGA